MRAIDLRTPPHRSHRPAQGARKRLTAVALRVLPLALAAATLVSPARADETELQRQAQAQQEEGRERATRRRSWRREGPGIVDKILQITDLVAVAESMVGEGSPRRAQAKLRRAMRRLEKVGDQLLQLLDTQPREPRECGASSPPTSPG